MDNYRGSGCLMRKRQVLRAAMTRGLRWLVVYSHGRKNFYCCANIRSRV